MLVNRVGAGEEGALRLLGLFFEELADLLGDPEIREEMRREGDLRVLYLNQRRFPGEEGLNPPRG
jgi:hypothetical protein